MFFLSIHSTTPRFKRFHAIKVKFNVKKLSMEHARLHRIQQTNKPRRQFIYRDHTKNSSENVLRSILTVFASQPSSFISSNFYFLMLCAFSIFHSSFHSTKLQSEIVAFVRAHELVLMNLFVNASKLNERVEEMGRGKNDNCDSYSFSSLITVNCSHRCFIAASCNFSFLLSFLIFRSRKSFKMLLVLLWPFS